MMRFRKKNAPLIPIPFPQDLNLPKISVIVPAKNEEKNLSNCLLPLLKQDYADYEIIVVDDRSEDQTPQILETLKKNPRVPLKIIRVDKLPPGWTGKNYALFTGSKAASGSWFLFTDADTTHQAQSLSTAVAEALRKKIDFLTLAPETECRSFWEKTVQPLAVGSLALWFDPEKINNPKSGVTLANGQFILIRKEAYEKIGGNESVKMEVIEDVELAKKARQAGYHVQFLNGTLLYRTRMYATLQEIQTGWTRIFTYLFKKNPLAILHKIFMFVVFSCLPFFVLIVEIGIGSVSPDSFYKDVFLLSFAVSLAIVAIRFVGNKLIRSNPWFAFLHLLGSLVMIWILLICLSRILLNRPSSWRGDLHR